MDFLFELIFTLLFDGALDISKNKKIAKPIRYFIATILALFVLGVLGGTLTAGVVVIARGKVFLGALVVFLVAIIIACGVLRIVKEVKIKKALDKALEK